jgi:hypothetical protein
VHHISISDRRENFLSNGQEILAKNWSEVLLTGREAEFLDQWSKNSSEPTRDWIVDEKVGLDDQASFYE